ncbi:MAG TPA: glycosyltransferase family 39 protein [Candidatus Peribacteria bacterium]|nr:glycosyltransferase family 39 protein [Candidatus Peribacteria bacterium]
MQLSQLGSYGAVWDEPLHRGWALDFLRWWQTNDWSVIEGMPGLGMYYGPLYYAANSFVAGIVHGWFHVPFVAANHVLGVCITSLCVWMVFEFAQDLFGKRVAVASTLFFALYTPLIAHAQYNVKDVPLMVAVTGALWLSHRALQSKSLAYTAGAGAAFGAALAIKVSALLVLPVPLAACALRWMVKKRHGKRNKLMGAHAGFACVFALCMALTTILLWPTLWHDILLPLEALQTFRSQHFWNANAIYLGQAYPWGLTPWHYIPLSFVIATPTVTLISAMVGGLLPCLSKGERSQWHSTAWLLLWLLNPVVLTMRGDLVRYNGMRQFFFCVPSIAMLAGSGLDAIMRALESQRVLRRFRPAAAVAVLAAVSLCAEAAIVHPYEGSYANEVVRTLAGPRLAEVFDIEYWGSTYKEGLSWLEKNAPPSSVICVHFSEGVIGWYPVRPDLRFACDERSAYTMFVASFPAGAPGADQHEFDGRTPAFSVLRYGVRLMNIYKR